MPYTVTVSLEKFLERITPTALQSQTASRRQGAILEMLASRFKLVNRIPTGSFQRRTALRNVSDADAIAVFDILWALFKTPRQLLENVRDETIAEWSRLQLEQAWLADASHVERKARDELGMDQPSETQILVVEQ